MQAYVELWSTTTMSNYTHRQSFRL